jgi:hypothetical protein
VSALELAGIDLDKRAKGVWGRREKNASNSRPMKGMTDITGLVDLMVRALDLIAWLGSKMLGVEWGVWNQGSGTNPVHSVVSPARNTLGGRPVIFASPMKADSLSPAPGPGSAYNIAAQEQLAATIARRCASSYTSEDLQQLNELAADLVAQIQLKPGTREEVKQLEIGRLLTNRILLNAEEEKLAGLSAIVAKTGAREKGLFKNILSTAQHIYDLRAHSHPSSDRASRKSDYEHVHALLRSAVALDPGDRTLSNDYATALFHLGKLDASLDAFRSLEATYGNRQLPRRVACGIGYVLNAKARELLLGFISDSRNGNWDEAILSATQKSLSGPANRTRRRYRALIAGYPRQTHASAASIMRSLKGCRAAPIQSRTTPSCS